MSSLPTPIRNGCLVVALAGLVAGCTSEHEISLQEFMQLDTTDVLKVEGKPFSGVLVARDGEVVRARVEMDDGRPDGTVEDFYKNGKPASKREFHWDADKAKLIEDGEFIKWREDGVMRLRKKYDDGELELEETWCENGKPDQRLEYKNGEKAKGAGWSCETGKPVAETHYNAKGEPEGEQKQWDPKGTLIVLQRYQAGKLQGVQESWYPNGKRRSRGEFRADVQVGKQEAWYEKGQVAESGIYSPEGNKQGLWRENTSSWIDGIWKGYGEEGAIPELKHYGPNGFIKQELVGAYVEALGDGQRPNPELIEFYLKDGQVSVKDALPLDYNGRASSSTFEFPQSRWTYAVVVAAPSVLPVLLASGADINQADSLGGTRLMQCAVQFNSGSSNRECGLTQLTEVISKGAKASAVDASGRNALHYLLDDSSRKDHTFWERAIPAAVQARKDAIAALVKAGADVNARDKDGWTPLVLALSERRGDLAVTLLEQGAGVNIEGPNGTKPVHWVALKSPDRYQINEDEFTSTMLQELARRGADVKAPMQWDGSAVTLRDLAMRHGLIKFVRQLDTISGT